MHIIRNTAKSCELIIILSTGGNDAVALKTKIWNQPADIHKN